MKANSFVRFTLASSNSSFRILACASLSSTVSSCRVTCKNLWTYDSSPEASTSVRLNPATHKKKIRLATSQWDFIFSLAPCVSYILMDLDEVSTSAWAWVAPRFSRSSLSRCCTLFFLCGAGRLSGERT